MTLHPTSNESNNQNKQTKKYNKLTQQQSLRDYARAKLFSISESLCGTS